MKHRISNISILQTSKVAAILYALFGLILVPFGCALLALGTDDPSYTYIAIFYLCAPVFYAVIGFIFTAIGVWIYNIIAKRIGGVEFTLEQAPAQ